MVLSPFVPRFLSFLFVIHDWRFFVSSRSAKLEVCAHKDMCNNGSITEISDETCLDFGEPAPITCPTTTTSTTTTSTTTTSTSTRSPTSTSTSTKSTSTTTAAGKGQQTTRMRRIRTRVPNSASWENLLSMHTIIISILMFFGCCIWLCSAGNLPMWLSFAFLSLSFVRFLCSPKYKWTTVTEYTSFSTLELKNTIVVPLPCNAEGADAAQSATGTQY